MEPIEFKVENDVVPIETIMVHFQRGDTPDARPFSLVVASKYVKEVFDPHGTCPPDTPLDAHIMDLVSEMGTFVTQLCLQSILRLQGKELVAVRWVIATVEDVNNTDAGMVVKGKVVPFDPWRWPRV